MYFESEYPHESHYFFAQGMPRALRKNGQYAKGVMHAEFVTTGHYRISSTLQTFGLHRLLIPVKAELVEHIALAALLMGSLLSVGSALLLWVIAKRAKKVVREHSGGFPTSVIAALRR